MRGVLPDVFDPAKGPRVPMLLLDLLDIAEGQSCGTPRRVRRQAAGLQIVLKQRQVRLDLAGEVRLRPAQPEQIQHAFEKATHRRASYPSSTSSLSTSADSLRHRAA